MPSGSPRDFPNAEWGFYAHRLINRLAIYTLPYEMLGFFKAQADRIEERAVLPDNRRYVLLTEGIRHYIDLDVWQSHGHLPPRRWWEYAVAYYEIVRLRDDTAEVMDLEMLSQEICQCIDSLAVASFWKQPEAVDLVPCGMTEVVLRHIWIEHGVLPYQILSMYRLLEEAFMRRDADAVVRYAAELGHYVADAHVPLHTHSNYDGQYSNQRGIHAFWESRIPELLAESEFDLFVGKAVYIEDLNKWVWQVLEESHQLTKDVFRAHQQATQRTPTHLRYEVVLRGEQIVSQESKTYIRYFNEALAGMVERRMRQAIRAVGSIWFTAWVNAGQPQFNTTFSGQYTHEDSLFLRVPAHDCQRAPKR